MNLRFSYSSMTTPLEIYDYDMASRARVSRKRQEIPSGHNVADYVTTRIMATSHDGAEVPVLLLHRRDFVRDASAPLLLYGYGSDGVAMPRVVDQPTVAGRPRFCRRHRAYQRRHRQGLGLVSRRQAREEDQQL